MINLIPPRGRTAVSREYWLRVGTVWLLLIAFALLIIGTLNIPAYLMIQAETRSVAAQYDEAKSQQLELGSAQASIEAANLIANHLVVDEAASISFSELITMLDQLSGPEIAITQFGLSRGADGLGDIEIIGEAENRAALSAFTDMIETNPLFAEAKIPISNLAKDAEIPFSITIRPAGRSE